MLNVFMIKSLSMISYNYNIKRIVFGIFVFAGFSLLSLWLLIDPERFIHSYILRKKIYIQTLGILGFTGSLIFVLSFILLLLNLKDKAIIISDEFIIDNSKYESIGKIDYKYISDVKRIQNALQIILKVPVINIKKLNILQKILMFMTNWKYKYSIIISCPIIKDCNVNKLQKQIMMRLKKYNNRNT